MSESGCNRISRIVMIYREENLDAATTAFASALGICDFEAPITPRGFGLRIVVSWNAGIELIAPHGEDGFSAQARAYLYQHGEGLFGLVYAVADLDAAEARAADAGYPRKSDRINCFSANLDWAQRFTLAMEAPLTPIAGVGVTLIQLEAKM